LASFKNLTISGKEQSERWGVDLPNLSYIVLKHNLTVLNPPSDLMSRIFFRPEKHKVDVESVLRIIHQSPDNGLLNNFFLRSEIESLHLPQSFLQSCSKLRWDRKSSRVIGWGSDRVSDTEKAEIEISQRLRFCRGDENDRQLKRPDSPPVFSDTPKESAIAEKPLEYTLRTVIEAHEAGIKQHSNVYSLIGKIWFVKFKQTEWGIYPDQEKYKYLAYLLDLPRIYPNNEGLEFSLTNSELVDRVKKREVLDEKHYSSEDLKELNESNLNYELTKEEISRFEDIGYSLLEDYENAKKSGDLKAIARAEDKINKFRQQLFSDYGIKTVLSNNKRDLALKVKALHRLNENDEKKRQIVKNQVGNAKEDFHERMPMFWMHLDRSVKMKSYKTFYTPETHISWHVSI